MLRLLVQAAAGLVFLLAVIAAALFGAGGGLGYREAWVFLGVFGGCVAAITIDLAVRDPALLERRVKAGPVAERSGRQKIIQSLASLAFVAVFVVSGLDHRWGWSAVWGALAIAGDVVVALGLAIVFLVFRANSFTSAVIEVRQDQRLVTTGPYAVVRHPMYAGALAMLAGTPIALGSWWGECGVAVLAAVIVWRLLDEETVLEKELPGYDEYRRRVRNRLVPFIW